jgi:hypothetical protein
MTSRAAASGFYVTAASGGGSAAGASNPKRPEVVTGAVTVGAGPATAYATFQATVTTNGYPTGVFWTYRLTGTAQASVTGTVIVSASTPVSSVTFDVVGLQLNKAYEVTASVFHTDGPFTSQVVSGDLVLFTTPVASSTPPVAVTRPADNIGSTSATLHGAVNPQGTSTSAVFTYFGPDGVEHTTAAVDCGSGSAQVQVAVVVTDLVASSGYFTRIVATNTAGQTTNGNLLGFVTLADTSAPTVGVLTVSNITATTATATVAYDTGDLDCTVVVQVGLDTNYGLPGNPFQVNVLAGSTSFVIPIVGLSASQTYHTRAVVVNAIGNSTGADQTFATIGAGSFPTGNTALPDKINSFNATLHALVNPGGALTTVSFEWWREDLPSVVHTVASLTTSSGTSQVDFPGFAGNLQPFVLYNYRMTATNANGSVVGQVIQFKSQGGSTEVVVGVTTTTPATNITNTSATVSGTIADSVIPTVHYFEYWVTGQDKKFTTARFQDYGLTGLAGTRTESESISGLSANTTYNFRLCAVNSGSPDVIYGTTRTVLTNAAPGTPAAIGVLTLATSPLATSLRCDGTVNPNGEATDCRFQASSTPAFTAIAGQTAIETTGAGTSVVALTQATITGLTAATQYWLRVKMVHNVGPITSYSATYGPITTASVVAPTIGNAVLANPTPTTIQATASVTIPAPTGGGDVYVWFEYGTTMQASGSGYDVVMAEQNVGQVAGTYPVTVQLGGPGYPPLVPSTTYYCRAKVRNAIGQSNIAAAEGSNSTTGGSSSPNPILTCKSVKNLTPHHFDMEGAVQTNGSDTDITFEYCPASDTLGGGTTVSRTVQTITDTTKQWSIGDHSDFIPAPTVPVSATIYSQWKWRIKAVNATAVPIFAYPAVAQVDLPVPVPNANFPVAIVQNQTSQNLTFMDAESARLRFYCKHNGQRMWMRMEWDTNSTVPIATCNKSRWVSFWGPPAGQLAGGAGAQGEMRYADYLTGLTEGTQYYFRLRCWSKEGEHTSSIAFIVTPLSGPAATDSYCANWAASVGTSGNTLRTARNMMGPVPANLRTGASTRTTTQEVVWVDASPTVDYTSAEDAYTILVTPTQISSPTGLFTTRVQTDSSSTPNLAYALRQARVGDKIRMDGSHRTIAGRFALQNLTNPLLSGMQGTISAGQTVGDLAGTWTGMVTKIVYTLDNPSTGADERKSTFQIRILTGTPPTSDATITPGGDPTSLAGVPLGNIYRVGATTNYIQGIKLYYSGTYLYQGVEVGGDASNAYAGTPSNSIAYWKGLVNSVEKRYPITGVRVMALVSTQPWGITNLTFGNAQGGFNGIFFKNMYVNPVSTEVAPAVIVTGQSGAGGGGVWGLSDCVFESSDPTTYGGWGVKWHIRGQSPTTSDIRRCTFSPSNEHARYMDSDGEINPSDTFFIDCSHAGTSPDGLKTFSQRAFTQVDARGDLSQHSATGPGYPPGRGTLNILRCTGRAGNSAGCVSIWGFFGVVRVDTFTHNEIPNAQGGQTDQAFVIQDDTNEKGMWLNENGYSCQEFYVTNYISNVTNNHSEFAKFRSVQTITIDTFTFNNPNNKQLFDFWETGAFDNGLVQFTGAGAGTDALYNYSHWPPTTQVNLTNRITHTNVGLATPAEFQELQDGKQYTVIN